MFSSFTYDDHARLVFKYLHDGAGGQIPYFGFFLDGVMPHRMGRCEFSRLLPNLPSVGLPGPCSILVEIGILTTCHSPSDARLHWTYRSKVSLSGRSKAGCHSL
jgi:hypothetical protein